MNHPIMIMMIGLPGSGKSHKAKELADAHDANVHSSDAIRQELLGDINAQDANGVVFATLHNRIKEDLRNGKSCIYDATNINYKRRRAFLNELKNIPCHKVCILMATPYAECLKNDAARERHVPEHVIERMYRQFDVPWYYEGWDEIIVEYYHDSNGCLGRAQDWYEKYQDYNQDNSHHTMTLGNHCLETMKYFDHYGVIHSNELRYAAMIHDCGKPFCKTFVNGKGEIADQAHYYSHEHVSNYDCLFYEMHCDNLYASVLIRWHMQPYFWEKDNNEKLRDKYKCLWGDELYNDIMKLHAGDKMAH